MNTSQTDQDVDNRCRFCEQPVRWSTDYDEPHWVHVKAVDTIACPQYSGTAR